MARRSRSQSASPNKVLVIFLVLFILISIGGFVWGYTLKKDQDKFDSAARQKTEELNKVNQSAEWLKYQRDELLAAIGVQQFSNKAEVVKAWKDNRVSFMKGEKYKNEDNEEDFRAVVKSLESVLDGYNDGYRQKLGELPKQLNAELAATREKLSAKSLDHSAKVQELAALEKKYTEYRDALQKSIQAGNDKIFNARKEATETMNTAIRQNDELQKQLKVKEDEYGKTLAAKEAMIRAYQQQPVKQPEDPKSPTRSTGEPHALVLDISTGKPLWDTPRGKIVRVEDSGKRLFINKGAGDGIKPGLTFNVFSAGLNGQSQGTLKATIEVVRVEGAGTSVCKVNTFYDPDRREIAVAEATPGQLFRDGGQALKEGDLLFNVLWGTHVAIAGIVEWQAGDTRTPIAQADTLREFMRQLERLGITVDCYIDPRDGKIVGDITSKTNFLVRGNKAAVLPDADENRTKAINDNMKALRDRAIESGLFVVSVENLAVISGYGFRRSLGVGAQPTIGFIPGPPAAQPPPDSQKKDQ